MLAKQGQITLIHRRIDNAPKTGMEQTCNKNGGKQNHQNNKRQETQHKPLKRWLIAGHSCLWKSQNKKDKKKRRTRFQN